MARIGATLAMNSHANFQLVLATAGTLFSLFLMILIVGYRRRRVFERVLFFLALALFFYYSGILLLLNASQFYLTGIPSSTAKIIDLLISVGFVALPALLIHTHLAYGRDQLGMPWRWWHTTVIIFAYLPVVGFGMVILQNGFSAQDKFGSPTGEISATPNMVWLIATIIICVAMQISLARRARTTVQRNFHSFFAIYFATVGLLAVRLFIAQSAMQDGTSAPAYPAAGGLDYWMLIGVIFAWVLPLAAVVYAIVRYQALGIGSQKNLVYSVSIAFLAVLYLSVVRRVCEWAEPYFPPDATAGLLLFLLLAFFEPLQRFASRLLRRGFQEQVDRLQRLSAELQREALRGEPGSLLMFAEEHIRQEFELELVQIRLKAPGANGALVESEQRKRKAMAARPAWAGQPVCLRLGKPGAEMGELEVVPVGSAISGEASAALDFLAEQLPAVIELCRVIEQKVALERELDERERMALVGQMAASISHNLKNPLGSMKTILQVQLENSSLPAGARGDLSMVLGELDRLSAKLNQLLQYARPAVRSSGAAPSRVEVGAVAEQVVSLLRHDAERRRVSLTLSDESGNAQVRGPQEALADILSNLVVNAIEAMADGGAISVGVTREADNVVLAIVDDGPGISVGDRANVFRPFFTTKPSGTGLGLAIVERRAAELGGSVACESPVIEGRGTKFIVRLPLIEIEN
jgi:signal transduction histidine kinase